MDSPFGDFTELASLIVLEQRVRAAGLQFGARLTWLFPEDVLPGVTIAYGHPVERAVCDEPALVLRPLGRSSSGE